MLAFVIKLWAEINNSVKNFDVCIMDYPSKHIENAVTEIAKLPGIGKKTALRLVLFLLKQPDSFAEGLSSAINSLVQETRYCKTCHMVGDSEECFCRTASRDTSVLCVVEDIPDIMAIQNTAQYRGLFHILGGVISPINGIGPDDLHINTLLQRLDVEPIEEIILALPATMEGDTTSFYIAKKLMNKNIRVSTIARGVPVGSELEYTDEVTLGRSILTRTEYKIND